MSSVRSYADLCSRIPVWAFLIAGALMVCTIAGCGGDRVLEGILDEERIPERPLRYAGNVTLDLREAVELLADKDMPGSGVLIGWVSHLRAP